VLLVVFAIADWAWDSEFPDLFGRYSDIIWLAVDYALLLISILGFVFFAIVLFRGIPGKTFTGKDVLLLSYLLLIFLVYMVRSLL